MKSNSNFRKLGLAICAVAAFFLVISLQMDSYSSIKRDLLAENDEKDVPVMTALDEDAEGKSDRPIVKTFYQSMKHPTSDEIDDPIVQVWKEEWELAGFEPQVVTLADAKRHPYYDTMKEALMEKFPTDLYNQYCFFRYLAMAATGGGWHTDYDTMPSNFPLSEAVPLPNDGQFTSFQTFIPSLISASEEEWTRVAKLITEQTALTKEKHASDMNMLRDIYGIKDMNGITFSKKVLSPEDVVEGKNFMRCDRMEKSFAVHYSHHGLDMLNRRGKYPIEVIHPSQLSWSVTRAKAIKAIMKDYREQCKMTNKVKKEKSNVDVKKISAESL